MSDSAAIAVDKLSKRYAGTASYALKDLSLSVMPGEVYGFLGANGAGKSTTIRLLMNFISPSAGSAKILGLDSVTDSVNIKRHVGYLAGEIALYGKMTGRQLLQTLGRFQPVDTVYFEELIDRFDAELDKPIAKLSKGNRQKIGIVQAFMHQPQVLILDEPTSGLDPLMQEEFYDVVRQASARGAAIFVSSHNLSEVQKMCDRVGIIRGGVLITEKSVAEMTGAESQRFTVSFGKSIPKGLSSLSNIHILNHSDTTVTVEVEGSLQPFLAFLGKHDVSALTNEQTDLEEEFLHYYGEEASK